MEGRTEGEAELNRRLYQRLESLQTRSEDGPLLGLCLFGCMCITRAVALSAH